MRIALVKPRIGTGERGRYVEKARMEPLTLGVIAALTPPDVDVRLHDDRMEDVAYDEPVSLAAITVETWTARRSYEIAAEYRKRGVPVILGGIHVTLAPDEARAHADSIFLGDAEQGWTEVVGDVRAGRLRPEYRASAGIAQSSGVQPRADLYGGKGYLPISLVQFSRGCPFACSFCAVSPYFDRKLFHREIDRVVGEVESRGRHIVFFVDDNITAHKERAKELFRALVPLRIRWVSQASIDMTLDAELMSLMARSGCLGHVVGFESIEAATLREMRKAAPNLSGHRDAQYAAQVEVLRDHGLQTWASFTFGHDGDTLDTVQRTLEWAIRQKFAMAAFNILTPYPGTELYRRLASEGRLLWGGRWWLHPDYRLNGAPFVPRRVAPDALVDALAVARREWSAPWTMLGRFLDRRTHLSSPYRMAVYWKYNPIFGRENAQKDGIGFGTERVVGAAG